MFVSMTRGADRTPIAWLIGLALTALVAVASPTVAQNLTSGSIDGIVSDETGGAMPGVTVVATSRALQVPNVTALTDGDGRYRLIDLPPGTYQLRFELQGFQPLVRENLALVAGFAARVNISLKVGSVEETVTVSGASPVVDLSSTDGGRNVPTDLISLALPGNKNLADLIEMTPGLKANDGFKNGAIGLNARARFNMYGVDSGNTNLTVMVDGFQVIPNQNHEIANTEETDIKSYGNGAEVREAGTYMNLVTKSGGNDFHGRLSEGYMWQPKGNLTPELRARGLSVGTELKYFNDGSGDLGGRIIRDKLWFFGSLRHRSNKTGLAGLQLDAGPDGKYLTGDEPPGIPKARVSHMAIKGSYQISPKYQFVADYGKERTHKEADGQTTPFAAQQTDLAGFGKIAFEATNIFDWTPTRFKFELKGTPTSRLFFDQQFGRSTYLLDYVRQPVCGDRPGIYDRSTLMLTGCAILRQSDFTMWIANGNLTYVPTKFLGGNHEFKAGYHLSMRDITGNVDPTSKFKNGFGDYNLLFDTVGGVPNQAAEFETNNAPVTPDNWDNVYSAFVTDQWRVGQRLTFNLGVRIDQQHSWVPEQNRAAGEWTPAATFPRVEVGRWTSMAPRVAVAWDMTGSGRSVLKSTYGWFNNSTDIAGDYNQFTSCTTRYRWNDVNRNSDYDPSEVGFNNPADFISTTCASGNRVNPDLLLAHQHEISTSFEHELMPNLAVRGLFLLKQNADDSGTVNVLRPYSAFNIPISRRDPGPDGNLGTADDGGTVTIYDYDPAFRGSAFVGNLRVNRPGGRNDRYTSFEGSINRRLTGRWSMLGAYTATKYHRWITPGGAIPQSPNDEFFPLDDAWRWDFKLNGNLTLPKDFQVGTIVQVSNGLLGQRTYVFRATDPSGPPLRQLTTATIRLEPFGSQKEAAQTIFNLRLGKKVAVGKRALNLSVDALNVMNANAIRLATYVSGPSFGAASDNISPRVFRVGATLDF
jgi:carboxypeptidase family protein